MMEMLVTLYVPRTAPLAAALEGKAAQGAQRNVRGGLPGTPRTVCGEQGCGQKDVHAEARADCAGRPAGNENVRGALGCADEEACGMRSGVHTEARAGREDKNRSGVWKDACPEQSREAHGFQSGGGPQAAQGVRPGR